MIPFLPAREDRLLSLDDVYRAHADFVWLTLQRLGVADSDLPDVLQEVFVVVHRRLGSFTGESAMTTWLFGICWRLVKNHRRVAHRRREQVTDAVDFAGPSLQRDPEQAAAHVQDRARLDAVLDAMDFEKRAVFVMFELEELSSDEIAALLAVPVGTVYSRLHAARAQFRTLAARHRARREQQEER